ncbi:MAG: hypothetical protein WCD35_15390 [Mycobacteriales bacterium]
MSLPAVNETPSAGTSNVRLVIVDDNHQPVYLQRAARLEQALLQAAAAFGIDEEDLPGLHGLSVEAVRSAERHGH